MSTLGQKERQQGITYHLPDCNTTVRICVIHRIKGPETRLGKYKVSKALREPSLKSLLSRGKNQATQIYHRASHTTRCGTWAAPNVPASIKKVWKLKDWFQEGNRDSNSLRMDLSHLSTSTSESLGQRQGCGTIHHIPLNW
jgi:hypothetical protein